MVSSASWAAQRCLEYLGKVAPVPLFNRETFGPPEFPGYPYEQMTRSQIPVVTSMLAMTHKVCFLPENQICRLSLNSTCVAEFIH